MLCKHILILIVFINFNFFLQVYGNSKPQCNKCLYQCCNSSFDDLKSCKKTCRTDHCDGIDIDIEGYKCPIAACNICLNKCCDDFDRPEDFHKCADTCKLKDCKNLGFIYKCEKIKITIISTLPVCTKCLKKCCHGDFHKFEDCSNTCSELEDCKNIDFNHKIYEAECEPTKTTTTTTKPSTSKETTTEPTDDVTPTDGDTPTAGVTPTDDVTPTDGGDTPTSGVTPTDDVTPTDGGDTPTAGEATVGVTPTDGGDTPTAGEATVGVTPSAGDVSPTAGEATVGVTPTAADVSPTAGGVAPTDDVSPTAGPIKEPPVVPSSVIPKAENTLGPVPPFPPQGVTTCTSDDDPVCFPPGSTKTVVTYTQPGVETPTPPGDNANLITTQTTSSLYVASYTTTDSSGQTTIAIPSTLLLIKNIAVTEAPITTTVISVSTKLHDFDSHGLWGITISLVIVTTTLVFMVIT